MRLTQIARARWRLSVLALTTLLSAAGCARTGIVSGTVTYDGQPLPAGRITFVAADGRKQSAMIENGVYEVSQVPPGVCKVAVETAFLKDALSMSRPGGPATIGAAMPPVGMGQSLPGSGVPDMRNGPTAARQRLNLQHDPAIREHLEELAGKFVEIPELYASAERSGLTYTVTAGSQTFNIPLEKKPGPGRGAGK
jgi:hypothetical protein